MLPDVRQKARKFLIKMSIASGVLPEKLQIKGVTRTSQMRGGTSAELWRGSYEGRVVVVKCLEFLGDARNCLIYHRVGHMLESLYVHSSVSPIGCQKLNREAITWQQLKHEHVLEFMGTDGDSTSRNPCLVSLWMKNGNVLEYMKKKKGLNINVNRLVSFGFLPRFDTRSYNSFTSFTKPHWECNIFMEKALCMATFVE
jgi:hypothetical protein